MMKPHETQATALKHLRHVARLFGMFAISFVLALIFGIYGDSTFNVLGYGNHRGGGGGGSYYPILLITTGLGSGLLLRDLLKAWKDYRSTCKK